MAARTVIELNDCELTVVRGDTILARSTGVAVVKQDVLKLGYPALKLAHLDPRHTFRHFWRNLNQDPLKSPAKSVRHNADLAYAHLLAIWEEAGRPDEMVFAVPGNLSNEQLALLLGLIEASPFAISGLVDAAVAAAATTAGAGSYVYLDIHLHHAILTMLEVSKTVKRKAVEVIDDVGLLTIHDKCAHFIADLFVQQSRFDPLHHGETEQALYDQLPQCLQSLKNQNDVSVEIQYEHTHYQARINRRALLKVVTPLYEKITHGIDGEAICLLNGRLDRLPCFTDHVSNYHLLHQRAVFDGCMTCPLPERSRDNSAHFVTQLQASAKPTIASATETPATSKNKKYTGLTGILISNTGYPFKEGPLYLSASGSVEDSREDADCCISLKDNIAILSLEKNIAVRVNDQPLKTTAALRPGDQITFTDSNITCEVIRIIS